MRRQDVRAIVRLLSQVGLLPGDVSVRRQALAKGLCDLVGAQVFHWMLGSTSVRRLPTALQAIDGGFTCDDHRELFAKGVAQQEAPDPVLQALLPSANHVTHTRQQLVPDEQWYASPFYQQYRRPLGLDHCVCTFVPVGDGVVSLLSMHRSTQLPPFTERDCDLLHVVAVETPWLHRDGSVVGENDGTDGLSARLREVLQLLLAGHSRKQVAFKLGISEHTVGDYVKALHRHFGVSSRGELLARFLKGRVEGK